MKELPRCLVCDFKNLEKFCDLGAHPLANNLEIAPGTSETYPLVVNYCPMCTHKQLSIAVEPSLLFKNYLYQTGISEIHKNYFDDFSEQVSKKMNKGVASILDIGCNDCAMLKCFKKRGWDVTGVEPSDNFSTPDITVIKDFFPSNQLLCEHYDVITAFNVFAHNDNPKEFLMEMKKLLRPNGRIYIQNTLARIDSFYHEHVSYFTPCSMSYLARSCGLEIRSIKEVTMHGLSNLYELAKPERCDITEMDHLKSLRNFVGYGASANGVVLMNHLKLRPEYVVDDNPLKQNKYIPGVGCPVVKSDVLANDKRDLKIVIFAYNLFDEIVEKIRQLRPGNFDKFIDPRRSK